MNQDSQTPTSHSAPSQPSGASVKIPLSPRRRRLRWTLAVLSALALLGVGMGAYAYLKTRPSQYRPGEKSSEITSTLARGIPPEAPAPRLSDVTQEAGLSSFRTFVGNRTSQLPEDMGPGAAWGDFDNDGDEDLFLVSAGGALNLPAEKLAPCELYENLGNGTFRKATSFPETRILGMGAAWGDYDGDGFLDLVVTGYNKLLLFHNEPDGTARRFVRDQRFPDRKGFWSSASWGDYDNDRALDLYVCGYVQYVESLSDRERGSEQLGTSVPYTLNPASYLGGTNLLFHNEGDGTFSEVAAKLGVTNPEGRSLGALWHDFDDDGWLDLYIANDISDNIFYRNERGKFVDISHPACVADYRSAMGLAAGDYDRDGDDDLYVTHWVAQENALYDNLSADLNRRPAAAKPAAMNVNQPANPSGGLTQTNPPTDARPRPLSQTKSPVRFMDIADMKGLGQMALQFVGWGAEFVDFDGDGWLDLIVANGSTLELNEPMPKRLKPQEPFLLWNRRGEFFHNLAPLNKSLSEPHVSRGLAVADYDNDGDMDALLVHLGEGAQLFRNDMQTGHWLKLRLRSRLKNGALLGFGDGAKVIAHIRDTALRRTVSSISYLSQSSRTLHFGLGPATVVDKLEVRWLGGATNFYSNVEADKMWEATEDAPDLKQVSPSSERPATLAGDRARQIEFWNKQRAAMDALKVEKNQAKAIPLFRAALALDPNHEDSRYYLGHCLASQGDAAGALAQLAELTRINPQSHRGYQQQGTLRAVFAKSRSDWDAAEQLLEKAHALNPEETGALLVLGEISLVRGEHEKAEQRLAAACRSNPRAAGGFFLRGYLAWRQNDLGRAQVLLAETRQALGQEWQPKGSTSEGDVKKKQHVEATPLARFWENWDGVADPAKAYAALAASLQAGIPR